MLIEMVEEIVAVARALKLNLPQEIAANTIAFIDSLPQNVTASMQRDVIAGRPSELGSQNGALVRMGLETGISTPLNAFIYHSLLPQELRARGEVDF